jgi:hypothetical protein
MNEYLEDIFFNLKADIYARQQVVTTPENRPVPTDVLSSHQPDEGCYSGRPTA